VTDGLGDRETPVFDVHTALRYAREGRLEDWVHAYLTAGPWANPEFSDGLKRQRRWWNGPLEVPLDALARAVGPEPEMEYVVERGPWAERTSRMAGSFTDPMAIPPLIVEYRAGILSVRDGNNRHEAMRVRGWPTCWVVIWYNSEQEHRRHTRELVRRGWMEDSQAIGR